MREHGKAFSSLPGETKAMALNKKFSLDSEDKVVLVLGAGASISEMSSAGIRSDRMPPSDKNFLEIAQKICRKDYGTIEQLFNKLWDYDRDFPIKYQRMEQLFANAYFNKSRFKGTTKEGRLAHKLYHKMVYMLRETVAETTKVMADPRQHMDILTKVLSFSPKSMSVISFNYDVLIDRALRRGNDANKWRWHHFDGYGFKPRTRSKKPNKLSEINLYKMHGSMNWYVPVDREKSEAYKPGAEITIPIPAKRPGVPEWMKKQGLIGHDKRRHAFPLIIPPIFEKTSKINKTLTTIWKKAQKTLNEASTVIVWGYSMPQTDYHAEMMFNQAARKANFKLIVINPEPIDLSRVTSVCGHNWNRWFFKIDHFFKILA